MPASRVAGARRPKPEPSILDGAMVIVALVPGPEGVEVRLENRVGADDEDIALALEEAANQLKGTHNRARGMW